MKRLMTALISITLLSLSSAWAQYTVRGQIVDAVGPVIGAAVLEQGTLNGTESDMDGNFVLTVPSASSMIEISLIGYKTLVFQADQVPAVIVLEDDTEMLEEVVVIGYGTVKKEDLTGSVATVRADQLNKGAVTSPAEMLKGKSAGVVITEGDGAPGSGSTIRIRGGSSLNAENSPLIVIDGLPITNEGISGVADQLSSINPSDIETFTVLKDASATAIYGSRASNGVIIITTKKGSKYDSAIPHVSADYTLSISQNAKYLDVMTGDEMRAAMLAYTGSETSEGYLALGDANTDWQKQIYQLGMSHEANVSLSGNFKFGDAGYMPYRVSGGYLNEKGTLKTSSMERGTISLNLTPTFFDDHLTISLNGKGMFQNNRFANTGAISAAIEYDPTQPVYSDHGLDGYQMWGNMATGTFEPNTQSTINPVAALYQRTDVSSASRFIGNAHPKPGVRVRVLHKKHRQAGKAETAQFGWGGAEDSFTFCSQIFPYMNLEMAETGVCKGLGQLRHIAPGEEKGESVAAHWLCRTALLPMGADQCCLLPGQVTFGEKRRYGGNAGDEFCIGVRRQQLCGAAVKAHIPGQEHRNAVMDMGIFRHISRSIARKTGLFFHKGCSQPGSAQNTVRRFHGRSGLAGQIPRGHSCPDDCQMGHTHSSCKRFLASSSEIPCSCPGRRSTQTSMPRARAASTFSRKPPAEPDSLVTKMSQLAARNIARFSSSEKGPCIQMRCFPGYPAAITLAKGSGVGSIRSQTRSWKF